MDESSIMSQTSNGVFITQVESLTSAHITFTDAISMIPFSGFMLTA